MTVCVCVCGGSFKKVSWIRQVYVGLWGIHGEKIRDKEEGRQGEQHKYKHVDWEHRREVAEGSGREEAGPTRIKDETE